jgi:hypothetical protein
MMHAIFHAPCKHESARLDCSTNLATGLHMFLIHHTDKTFDFSAKFYRNTGRALVTHIFFTGAHTPKNVERGNPSEAAPIVKFTAKEVNLTINKEFMS